MRSWRTTVCGAIGIAAGAIVAANFGPMVTKIATCIAGMAGPIGLLFAHDDRVARDEKKKLETEFFRKATS